MKRLFRIGFGIIFIAIGFIAVIVITNDMKLSDFVEDSKYQYHETTFNTEDVSLIKVLVDDRDIQFLSYDGTDILIQYYDKENEEISVSSELNEVHIESDFDWHAWFQWGFDRIFHPEVFDIIVYLPQDFIASLDLETSNGTVLVQELEITTLTIDTSNGVITLKDLAIANKTKLSTDNGVISIEQVTSSDELVGDTSNGKIKVENSSFSKVTLETSNGNIIVSNVTSDAIDLETSNGGITVTANSAFDDTYLSMSTSNGSYYIDGDKVTQNTYHDNMSISIKLKTMNGNIHVDFE